MFYALYFYDHYTPIPVFISEEISKQTNYLSKIVNNILYLTQSTY